jgi:hypothetical protein
MLIYFINLTLPGEGDRNNLNANRRQPVKKTLGPSLTPSYIIFTENKLNIDAR